MCRSTREIDPKEIKTLQDSNRGFHKSSSGNFSTEGDGETTFRSVNSVCF